MVIIFTETTVKDFVNDVLDADMDIQELQYYFIMNKVYYPIDELEVNVGGITVRNTWLNEYLDISTEEKGLIWRREIKK